MFVHVTHHLALELLALAERPPHSSRYSTSSKLVPSISQEPTDPEPRVDFSFYNAFPAAGVHSIKVKVFHDAAYPQM
ncbi:hypothetical protein VKT23_002904 [Stygiomarasmius scandens]|uniref:Uncharacterized protein n=1 Tax=Marasmiellus scandens TaxID=2682957 RepID=A0ABR1JX19_9AGAR